MSIVLKNKYVRVEVDDKLISVVELTGLELIKNGRVEAKYGYMLSPNGALHSSRRHSVGSSFARFSIRRWFKTGIQQPLFSSLHNNHTIFSIKQYINREVEGTYRGIQLNNCQIYRYHLVTGSPNDIIAEEIIGEATSWVGIEQGFLIQFFVNTGTSQIIFDGEYFSNGQSKKKVAGDYVISVSLQPSYAFDYWETSGDITVDNIYSSPTTAHVTGTGILTLHVYYTGC